MVLPSSSRLLGHFRASAVRITRRTEAAKPKRLTVCAPAPLASRAAFSTGANGGGKVTKEMLAHEGKEILKLMIGGVALSTIFIVTGGYAVETAKGLNPMPAPGRFVELVDKDGNAVKIHYQRRGSGDVTVLFDGGVGETSFDWDKVAEQVAPDATVLAIDRPGLGFSTTPGELPRTAEQIAKEYTEVLEKLNVPRKLVLVAHGAGGYNMRQLAHELQQQATGSTAFTCHGLVLVDALQENLRQELESVSDSVRSALAAMDNNGDKVLRLAKIGLIRLITTVQYKKTLAKYTKEAAPYVQFYSPTPAHRQAANWENAALPQTEQAFRDDVSRARRVDAPCVVLSHGKPDLFNGLQVQPGIDAGMIAAMERKWQEAQRLLAKTVASTPAVQVVVPDAGHCIHHEKPEAISRVVRALVHEARHPGERNGLESLKDGTCPI
ncbi:hypothetical protein ATCC90586_005826 [Pythium insidiosum]|nr:hypothetical protein ATCC90586_005826 [Pythium insidiosum]